jgi:formylglycine-generating enzyme required for sulfatase activity
MVLLGGNSFVMGSDSAEIFAYDGEAPARKVYLDAFYISKFPVTNMQYAEFVGKTGYVTDAEQFGWSLCFKDHVREDLRGESVPGTPWWIKVAGANWKQPNGPGCNGSGRDSYPVVQVSWNDSKAYCDWSGTRLPTEAEWEFAARGGLERKRFPWGDDLTPGGRHMCNIWQGVFPDTNSGEDGFTELCPVDSFEPNAFGLYTMVGNTWEWCFDRFDPLWHITATRSNPIGPDEGERRTLKGGSYLCHESYCYRYRNAARSGNTPDSATTHMGFRVARD